MTDKIEDGRSPTGRATAAAQSNPQAVSSETGIPNAVGHGEAVSLIVGAASVTVLSYQEAIEGYLTLRGMANAMAS